MNHTGTERHGALIFICAMALLLALGCENSSKTSGDVEQMMDGETTIDSGARRMDDGVDMTVPNEGDAGAFMGIDTGMPTAVDGGMDSDRDPPLDMGVDGATDGGSEAHQNPDLDEDGTLNILVIGTNRSIQESAAAFSPDEVAMELQRILSADESLALNVNVVAENIHRSKELLTGYGQGGDEYSWTYYGHSLMQYYFWPEDRDERLRNLAGQGEADWDQVIIAGDPQIIATMPGYYALGVNQVAAKVREGDGQPLLLMVWPQGANADATAHFREFTYRTSHGAKVDMPVIPAGWAWANLPANKKDTARLHPSPNGAYLTAATIYAHLTGRSAAASGYTYDDEIADAAQSAIVESATWGVDRAPRLFVSPFLGGHVTDRILNFNHTGTSSENGILRGLRWVLGQAQVNLERGGLSPINFNYGRANTEFEANKRYRIAPAEFEFSLGFPMQDHSNHGNTTMLYGLDKRRHDQENGTDLGVARKMIRDAELPHARAVPIRSLLAQMKDVIPAQSAYADGWHMNHDLDKATGAFMYTLLTGHCALGEEPLERESDQWRAWMAHKIGYETAWTLMHLNGRAPGFRLMPEAPGSIALGPMEATSLSVSFAHRPQGPVTVRLSANDEEIVMYEPAVLVFTPENHHVPQQVSMALQPGEPLGDSFTITARTESTDTAFDGVLDGWTYRITR